MYVIDPPDGHMATYLESLERLRGLDITTLYPAHGPAARSGRQIIERYLAHRAERQAKVAAALAAGTLAGIVVLIIAIGEQRAQAFAAAAVAGILAGTVARFIGPYPGPSTAILGLLIVAIVAPIHIQTVISVFRLRILNGS